MTKDAAVTLTPFEDTLTRMLFGRQQQQFSLSEKKAEVKPSSNGSASSSSASKRGTEPPSSAKRHAKKEDWGLSLSSRGKKKELLISQSVV